MKFKSLPQLLNHFKNESTCIKYLEKQRWGKKPCCPHCGCVGAYTLNDGRYKCKDKGCYKKFSVMVGTIFENSKVKLNLWFAAIYLATAHKKGISSLQLHRDLGVTQKTAWFMLHRIREMLREKQSPMLSGTVEADETYIGGDQKNMHQDKRKVGSGKEHKTPVLGMLERGGKIRTKKIGKADGKTIKPIVKREVSKNATLLTDGFGGYHGLDKHFADHQTLNHIKGEYVRGDYHTNNIENFWSMLKRGIYGIYHYASPKHIHRYCDEFAYRYNTRNDNDADRFTASLGRVDGKLTYKQLIGQTE